MSLCVNWQSTILENDLEQTFSYTFMKTYPYLINSDTHSCVPAYILTHTYTHIHTCLPTYIHIYIQIYIQTHMHTLKNAWFIHTCTHTFMHFCLHTYIYMYHMGSLNLLIQNVPRNEGNTIINWTYNFIVAALHQTWSWDMVTECIEIWESLWFETQDLRANSPVTESDYDHTSGLSDDLLQKRNQLPILLFRLLLI